MGIFTLFSTNFNYILYPFPFLCPKIQLIRFFFGTQTPRAGTHHTHYDIYFPRYPLNRPARPIPPQHQWSSPTNMAPMPPHPRRQLPSYFNTRRLLQPRRQLQCQVGHPLPQNSRLSSAENWRNRAITLKSKCFIVKPPHQHSGRIHTARHQEYTQWGGIDRRLPISVERAIPRP